MQGASQGVARRYARALFEVARELGQSEALRADLEQAARTLEGHRELRGGLTHPALPAERKRAVVAQLFGKANPLLGRALELLASRGRLPLLGAIAEAYARVALEAAGIVRAEVVTAIALSPEQQGRIQDAVAAAARKGVEIRASVDPELLGGVLVKIDGRHYDGTVKGSLRALRARLSLA